MSNLNDELFLAVDDYVRRAVKPLHEKIAAQEATIERLSVAAGNQLTITELTALCERVDAQAVQIRELESRLVIVRGIDGKNGEDGKSVAPSEVREMVADAVKAIPVPKDGTSVPVAEVRAMVAEAVKALPVPRDGENGTSVDVAEVRAMVVDAVRAIPIPKDGKSVELDDIAALAKDYIEDYIDALPKPKDGQDAPPVNEAAIVAKVLAQIPLPVDPADGKDGASAYEVAREHGFAGSALDWLASLRGKDGDDGVSILSALVDGDGELVLTASDGTQHRAGVVRGKDGAAGDAGRDAVALRPLPYIDDAKSYPAGVWALHAGGSWYAEQATVPLGDRKPQDCGWTPIAVGEAKCDIAMAADDLRTIVVTRTTSTGLTLERRFRVPVVIDRGIYTGGKQYEMGDAVTRAGSYFVARVDKPAGMPGASDDWRMLIKGAKP